MNKQNKMKLIDTDSRLVVTRTEGNWGWVKWVKGISCMVTYED